MLDDERIIDLLNRDLHWKAKELLQGRLSAPGYDSALYEAYGYVLLQMNDKLEAGKYLFLSGERSAEYSEPIRLYLDRYGGTDSSKIYHTCPKSGQDATYNSYPEQVRFELGQLGYTHRHLNKQIAKRTPHKSTFFNQLIGWFFLVVFAALFVGFLVQGFRGIVWVVSQLFGT